MKNKLTIIILFGVILLTEVLVGQLFPSLTFVNGSLVIINKIISYVSFFGLVFCIPILLKVDKWILMPIGLLLILPFSFLTFCAIYPIDTTTEPVDVMILRQDLGGEKLVVREYKNAKTNRVLTDTVLVKDILVFRQIL